MQAQPEVHGFLVALPTPTVRRIQAWPQPETVGGSAVWFEGYLANATPLRIELNLEKSAPFGRIVAAGLRRWPDTVGEHIFGEYAAVVASGTDAVLIGDRMGLRPLYYTSTSTGLVVSTDLGALVCETSSWREIDEDYLADMFSSGLHLGPRTPYRGIKRLQAGEFATFRAGQLELCGGWRPAAEQRPGTFDDHKELLREAVKSAVAQSVPSHGPAAVELSGGLDTSTVLAAATGLGPMHALSFVHPGHPGSDESAWMRAALDTTPASWHPIDATEQGTFTSGPDFGTFLPAPSRRILNWAPSAAEEAVARKTGVSTILTGEGGDAVFFAGLLPWYLADLLRTGKLKQLHRESLRWSAQSGLGRSSAFWLRRAAIDGLRRWRSGRTLTLETPRPITASAPWLRQDYVARWDLQSKAEIGAPIRATSVHGQAVLENVLRCVEFARSRHVFAPRDIEIRHPLLAPSLIDLALSTPWDVAADPRIDRAVQRYAFAGLVSDTVLRRRSKTIADEAILHGFERRSRWREYLGENPQIVTRGYVDTHAWRDALRAAGRIGGVTQFYTAIQIEVWLRHLTHAGAPKLLTNRPVAGPC